MRRIILRGPLQKMSPIGRAYGGGGAGAEVSVNGEVRRVPRNVPTSLPERFIDVLRDGGYRFEIERGEGA